MKKLRKVTIWQILSKERYYEKGTQPIKQCKCVNLFLFQLKYICFRGIYPWSSTWLARHGPDIGQWGQDAACLPPLYPIILMYIKTPLYHCRDRFAIMDEQHRNGFIIVCLRVDRHNPGQMKTCYSITAEWWLESGITTGITRLFTQPFIQTQIKENMKAPRHWPGDRSIPRTQMASNAENVSIWWRHHEAIACLPYAWNIQIFQGSCRMHIRTTFSIRQQKVSEVESELLFL